VNLLFHSCRASALVLTSMLLLCMTRSIATETGRSDIEQLLDNERAWARAAVDGEADRMASFMADEYLELSWEPATPTTSTHWSATSKNEWVQKVRNHTEVYTAVELKNLTVHLQGALAVVTGEYSQTGKNDGKENGSAGIYTNTWVKRKGRWLVVQSVFPSGFSESLHLSGQRRMECLRSRADCNSGGPRT
jgi:ketosteroid isomerase-like protein